MGGDMMMFPDTVEEYMEQYKVVDRDHAISNGAEFIPVFRMRQWFDHLQAHTNADRIRAMSDEELADWFFNEFFRKVPYCRKEECYEDTPCEECLLDWLKQEAE